MCVVVRAPVRGKTISFYNMAHPQYEIGFSKKYSYKFTFQFPAEIQQRTTTTTTTTTTVCLASFVSLAIGNGILNTASHKH